MTINLMPAAEARARNSAQTREAEEQSKDRLVKAIEGAVKHSVGRTSCSIPVYASDEDRPLYSQKVLAEIRKELSDLGYSSELSKTWLKISWEVNNG